MKNEEERERKAWKRGSGKSQKMMSFRLDAELTEELDKVKNKGRLINKLLHDFFESMRASSNQDEDDDPSWHDIEDEQA